uniref:NADH-ubiquinone oxidoreductase chain 4 n=1 Tax=Procambarus fallax TaxID=215716 RepID=L0E902_9EUCA|nr:NADH dehydrogenase subunit 4 [Procambarus fallax]AGA56113.1 NADH dehydrogenase subunit 4 [Procambarus fallax]ALM30840.1 NADH dehydrogenase subunit 4 [Procambarus fallax]ALM30853.1 NADH dehydrogenase subunit 4 [Procambarus fallax]
MVKFLFMNMMLVFLISSWGVVELALFLMCFLVFLSLGHDFYMFNLGLQLGTDYLSIILVMLSVWIIVLVIYSSQMVKKTNKFSCLFLFLNLILLFLLVMTFCSMDYLMFYLSFESSLIPTLILILGWGYQPERTQAGIYMLFYTLFASLPLLVSLISLYMVGGSLTMSLVKVGEYELSMINILWYFFTMLAFVVKLPMYLFHLWLPKAHVEAPVAGSMILAGVLLKLGGYGLIRVLSMFTEENKMFSWVWVGISVLGGVFVSILCLRQVDMKSLIAYSSVAHMSLVLGGLVVFSWWGMNGAVIIMVGHGLCSSGLFCLSNIIYERLGSRSLLINKGLLNLMPSLGLWWFLLSISNMAAPPTLNLLGEINLIISMISWSKVSMISLIGLSFFSAAYTLYLYSISQHGAFFSSLYACCSGKLSEYYILSLHWIPLNLMILKSSLFLPMI